MIEQQLWRIETELKRLSGNDLESLLGDHNNKIDSIIEKALSDLDELKPNEIKQSASRNQEQASTDACLSRNMNLAREQAHLASLASTHYLNSARDQAAAMQGFGAARGTYGFALANSPSTNFLGF